MAKKPTKSEKHQLELVQEWNTMHQIGEEVIVTKDDGKDVTTKTRSSAYMLGASGEYSGHTAVIMLDGISGCYSLERVRPAQKEDYNGLGVRRKNREHQER